MRLLPKILRPTSEQRRAELERSLIRQEAKIGGQLFGKTPAGHRRDFFALDEHTWIWHEEWTDDKGKQHSVTTRYEVRPGGVLKSQNGQPFQRLTKNEARNLYKAANLYQQRVNAEYQRMRTAA